MRVVFFGTPEFAVPSLSALLESGIEVVAVVTQPDRPAGRSHSRPIPPPVKRASLAAGIPVLQPERPADPECSQQLRDLHPDVGVVVAYGHLLKPDLLRIPRFGLVNVHASLLPRWRGAAPIQWALLSGDTATGVSIMRLEAGLDTGAVWQQERIAINQDDTAGTLTARLAELGAVTLVAVLPRIALGEAPTPQSDLGVTLAPKIRRDTARIRWDESPHAVSCRIRAMDPAPGAWTTLSGTDLKLFGPRVAPRTPATESGSGLAVGSIVPAGDRLVVVTADRGAVEIAEIQPAGKRRLAAAEWLHGAHLAGDARFV